MTVKKRPVSPRQKMINLMYIVLLAMLALNVSNEVLKGFDIVGDSLNRTTANAAKENEAIYKNFAQQLAANPTKVKPWYDKAMSVKHMADSLYNLAEQLRWDIAREADGKEGTPYATFPPAHPDVRCRQAAGGHHRLKPQHRRAAKAR